MATTFDAAVSWVLANEGSEFTMTPGDRGGATKFGVTFGTLQQWRRKYTPSAAPAAPIDVAALTRDDATTIYRDLYWTTIRGDEIHYPDVALAIMDTAVVCGPTAATKLAQKVCGCVADGILGPVTLGAINGRPRPQFIIAFVPALQSHFYGIVKADPSQSKFYSGWMARAARLLRLAL